MGLVLRASHLNVAQKILNDFFRYQIRGGLVGSFFLISGRTIFPKVLYMFLIGKDMGAISFLV